MSQQNNPARCKGMKSDGSRCMAFASSDGYCRHHPGKWMRKVEFADWQGVTRGTVSNWDREGKISDAVDDRGFVDWQKAQDLLAASRDPAYKLRRKGEAHPDATLPTRDLVVKASVQSQPAEDEEDEGDLTRSEVDSRYYAARMRKTEAEAAKKEIERRRLEGELVEVERVQADAIACAKQLRTSILNVPDRVAAQLAAERDQVEVHRILTEALRVALESVSVGLRGEVE